MLWLWRRIPAAFGLSPWQLGLPKVFTAWFRFVVIMWVEGWKVVPAATGQVRTALVSFLSAHFRTRVRNGNCGSLRLPEADDCLGGSVSCLSKSSGLLRVSCEVRRQRPPTLGTEDGLSLLWLSTCLQQRRRRLLSGGEGSRRQCACAYF